MHGCVMARFGVCEVCGWWQLVAWVDVSWWTRMRWDPVEPQGPTTRRGSLAGKREVSSCRRNFFLPETFRR